MYIRNRTNYTIYGKNIPIIKFSNTKCKFVRFHVLINLKCFVPNTYAQTKVATNKTLGMLSFKIINVI